MAEQQLSQRTGEAATSQSPCRLLVIDDDISICEVIEKLAHASHHHQRITAHDA
jgi:hypothetical protein